MSTEQKHVGSLSLTKKPDTESTFKCSFNLTNAYIHRYRTNSKDQTTKVSIELLLKVSFKHQMKISRGNLTDTSRTLRKFCKNNYGRIKGPGETGGKISPSDNTT